MSQPPRNVTSVVNNHCYVIEGEKKSSDSSQQKWRNWSASCKIKTIQNCVP